MRAVIHGRAIGLHDIQRDEFMGDWIKVFHHSIEAFAHDIKA